MSFKSDAFLDISNVFFNPEEFGEKHTLNGKSMYAVVDSSEVERRGKKQFEHSRVDGIYIDNLIVYVSRRDFGELPAHGRALDFDGRQYRVEDSRDEGGVYSIQLRRFGS